MPAVPVAQHMTATEFLALPERADPRRLQLVEGEVVVTEPSTLHNLLLRDILFALEVWCRGQSGRGDVYLPLDIEIDERNVYNPDLLWYSQSRVPGRYEPRPYSVPDIAVEVRSPSTWRYDIGAKKAGYERAGLRELWLVDTQAAEVLVFSRSHARAPTFDVALELERHQQLTSPLLSGFTLALAELFPER